MAVELGGEQGLAQVQIEAELLYVFWAAAPVEPEDLAVDMGEEEDLAEVEVDEELEQGMGGTP
eukprot:2149339-Karenia_brevis.AAC.1